MSDHDLNETADRLHLPRPLLKGAVVLILLLGAAGTGTYIWGQQYQNRIGPKTFIGPVDVSGLTLEAARESVQNHVDALLSNGLTLEFEGQKKVFPIATLIGTDLIEDASFGVEEVTATALRSHRNTQPVLDHLSLLASAIGPATHLAVPVTLNEDGLLASVRRVYPTSESASVDPEFTLTLAAGVWTGTVSSPQTGITFNENIFFQDVTRALQSLKTTTIHLETKTAEPSIGETQAHVQLNTAIAMLGRAPLSLTYQDSYGRDRALELTATNLAAMLAPSKNGVTLKKDLFVTLLQEVAPSIEREAKNAKLEMEEGRVHRFEASADGIKIDVDTTIAQVVAALQTDGVASIALATEVTKPETDIADLNDLGLSELLGSGTSSYRGSPSNRIKNIRNGVSLLNGILIAPDETFSLTAALQPFTFENGYLPELVIKGDKIEPELGGGLCQIGTTTFRATMNSGMPVVERRNHSLVVSYYNDPSNGNPGTDATIYEPAPDYKFTNDTGHYVLFQAEMLEDIQELRFSFWGTSDGRKGSYTPPIVHNWIPVGEEKEIETLDLEPGVRKCQEAHLGANASFTYTIVRPDGTEEDTEFDSHYRPLPRICLVGVETLSSETDPNAAAEGGVEADSTDANLTETSDSEVL